MANNIEKTIAKDLPAIKAVFFRPEEPFTWASGIKSPVYCDNRLTPDLDGGQKRRGRGSGAGDKRKLPLTQRC